MKSLHILNGDSTLRLFEKSGLRGETIVWREIMCEGPTLTNVHNPDFWELRKSFLQNYSPKAHEKYYPKLYEEFYHLKVENWEEITLWFEYDLFCQLNMLAVLTLLAGKEVGSYSKLSLICVGKEGEEKKLKGLGEFPAEEYPDLFKKRRTLSSHDLEFAHEVWKLYSSGKQKAIISFLAVHSNPAFPYILPAMKAHLQRYPQKIHGLNEIEAFVLENLNQEAQSMHQLVGKLLRRENYYGFGDLQYVEMVEELSPLYTQIGEKLELNEKGKSIAQAQENFMPFRKRNPQYGQNQLSDYCWEADEILENEGE